MTLRWRSRQTGSLAHRLAGWEAEVLHGAPSGRLPREALFLSVPYLDLPIYLTYLTYLTYPFLLSFQSNPQTWGRAA